LKAGREKGGRSAEHRQVISRGMKKSERLELIELARMLSAICLRSFKDFANRVNYNLGAIFLNEMTRIGYAHERSTGEFYGHGFLQFARELHISFPRVRTQDNDGHPRLVLDRSD
jgi:hypothetical protein